MAVNFSNIVLRSSLFLLFFIVSLTISVRLNVPMILLPYNLDQPSNYTLEVKEDPGETGHRCYTWYSNRPDIAIVYPTSTDGIDECSSTAVVSAVSRLPTRDTAIIIAEDYNFGQALRCDVIVDVIHSIEIVTTARILFLESAPELFEVQAKNSQGDTFSSLEGVSFEWNVISDSAQRSNGQSALRFLKLSESSYENPSAIDFWERQSLQGFMILMEGAKTGTAKVTVRPKNFAYENVKPCEVELKVVAHLNLQPALVYLLIGAEVRFHVQLIKQGKARAISLPSDQYFLEVADSKIASFDVQTSTLVALKHGFTRIVVKDRDIKISETESLPSANVYVTSPSYISLIIFPGQKWVLQEDRSYTVAVKIFDANNHPIHISNNVMVKVDFPQKYFSLKYSSLNGTYHIIHTITSGSSQITAELIGITNKDGDIIKANKVTTSQDVVIYQPIEVIPSFMLLPWNSVTRPQYTVYFSAVGGSGLYIWDSSDSKLVTMQPEERGSKIKVKIQGIGDAKITATESHYLLLRNFSVVSVRPVADMVVLTSFLEAEVGKSLFLPVELYAYVEEKAVKQMFNDCSKIDIKVEIIDETILTFKGISTSLVSQRGCISLLFTCISVGYSDVLIKYKADGVLLNATAHISCYKPLVLLYPEAMAVLPLGASIEVAFEGGPVPWRLSKSDHFLHIATNTTVVETQRLDTSCPYKELHIFRVLCKMLGEVTVELQIGNKASATNYNFAVSKASVKVLCEIPHSLILRPVLKKRRDILSCPPAEKNLKVPVFSYQDLEVELLVKDKLGHTFSNISSLDIYWELSPNTFAAMLNPRGVITKVIKVQCYHILDHTYQIVQPRGESGVLKVTAKIMGYDETVLKQLYFSIPTAYFSVSETLDLLLVNRADINPKKLSIFNSPLNKVYVNITKGSGYFDVEITDPNKAIVKYHKTYSFIEVVPLQTGVFTITVHDLCLEMQQPLVAQVHVYGVSYINVEMFNKVELGHTIRAIVEILDDEKQQITASVFPLVSLIPEPASDIISVRLQVPPTPQHPQVIFAVHGSSLGQTTLTFVIRSLQNVSTSRMFDDSHTYSSKPLPLQVFSPLQLSPKSITLVIGAEFQVMCSGGPQPQANTKFTINDTGIATVTTSGIVTAKKLGKTSLLARVLEKGKNGNYVVLTQDHVHINVVSLTGIKIQAPLTRMQTGTEMPLIAVGLNEYDTPFSFGTAFPRLQFRWSVNNENIAKIEGVYSQVNIQEIEENNFAIRIRAYQGGRVTVRVEVEMLKTENFHKNSRNFSEEMQIQVFEKLRLTEPEIDGNLILLSPGAQMTVKCNRFGAADVTYTILQDDPKHSLITVDNQGVLVAGSKTGEVTLEVTAKESFGIVQRLIVAVKVSELSYLMLHPITVVQTEWAVPSIPIGFQMTYVVTHHNDIGEIFHATNARLHFRPSRFDLIQITQSVNNKMFEVHALKPGNTILKVWDLENSDRADYISIRVGAAIEPSDIHLIMGDVVCFGSPLITQEGHRGTWSSSSNAVTIHPTSGGAVALVPGSAVISYVLSSKTTTFTQVTVKPVTSIIVQTPFTHPLSNVPKSKPYTIPVFLKGDGVQLKRNLVGKSCNNNSIITNLLLPLFPPPFTCHLEFTDPSVDITASDVFQSEIGYDIEKGHYYCNITILNKVSLEEISSMTTQLNLVVQMTSMDIADSTSFVPHQTVLLPFLPAFHTHVEEVLLSNIQPVAIVAVSSVPAMQECLTMDPSDSTLLEVLPSRVNQKQPHILLFSVRLREPANLHLHDVSDIYVDLICLLNSQHFRIPVKVKLVDQHGNDVHYPVNYGPVGWKSIPRMIWDSYHYFTVIILSVVGTIVALVIGSHILFGAKNVRVTSQPVFASQQDTRETSRTFSQTHMSPWQHSSPSSSPESPSYPYQPYLWSVDHPSRAASIRQRHF